MPASNTHIGYLLSTLVDMTGTTDGDSLEAELQRLASPDLLVAAEAETPKCDMCLQPAVLTYHETVGVHLPSYLSRSVLWTDGQCLKFEYVFITYETHCTGLPALQSVSVLETQ